MLDYPLVSRLLVVNVPSIGVMSSRPFIILYSKVALLTVLLSRKIHVAVVCLQVLWHWCDG